MADLTCQPALKLPPETESSVRTRRLQNKKWKKKILTREIKAPKEGRVGQDDNVLRAPDTSRSYHPARSTCMLSLPAHDRQEVVTDDRGSGYSRGNLSLQPRLLGALEGTLQIATSVPLVSQCVDIWRKLSLTAWSQWDPLSQKTKPTWEHEALKW